jgi:hypothetical protein
MLGQSIFELEPPKSISITGKGPGQDAAENPFSGTNCCGIIENIGDNKFTVRIQEKGKMVQTVSVKTKRNKKNQFTKRI